MKNTQSITKRTLYIIQLIVACIFIILGTALAIYECVYWLTHPELTQMQVFLETFWFQAGIFVFLIIGYILLPTPNKTQKQ